MIATQNPYGSLGEMVQKYDPDRYLITMMMSAEYHADLLALLAFNHEIAKTREIVTETRLGLIRLQWWREAIEEIYAGKEPRKHDVVEALAWAIKGRELSQNFFETLLYAREFDLEDVLPESLDGLVNYADFTTTPLLALIAQVMGEAQPDTDALQPIALNYALVNLMRAVPFHAQQRRCYLPSDKLKQIAQSVNKLYNLKPHENLPQVIESVIEVCAFDVKPENLFHQKLNRLAKLYAKQLKKNKFNVFDSRLARDPAFKTLRLMLG